MNLLGTIVLVVFGVLAGGGIVWQYVLLRESRSEYFAVRDINDDLRQEVATAVEKAQLSEMQLKSFEALVTQFATRPYQLLLSKEQVQEIAHTVGMHTAAAMDPKKLN